ncbi:putative CD48 antigen-like [Triplophysa rosa]|uniref:CD48 antigen-like n=2 Tax=Triplophysa rosa TaxID=992332 RepID=A0A9W8C8T2_TRIRA|nr:putative CD48 antigen-like [Triplophysa rosa]
MSRLIVLLSLFFCHLDDVFGDEVKSVSVMEGHSVTLHTHTELHTHDVIEWMFGVQSPDEIIAELYREVNMTSFINERLKNHVEIDAQTGSLIITNITTQHTGLYKAEISRKPSVLIRHFSLTVYAGLPVPVISRVSSQCSSSSSSSCCCVLCSVVNVSHDVSVSWYKGKSLLSSISVSDLNIRLSLPLEVEYQDTNTYRCVVNNPITNHTQHLHITQLCHTSEVCVGCCGFTEAVIRLVVSAVVGVATVAFLVYDVRSRRESPSTSDESAL